MAIGPPLIGRCAQLEAVREADAAQIIEIRNTPGFDVGLPPIPNDVARQEQWIRDQRRRADDFYFAIRATDADWAVGTIGITRLATIPGPWSDGESWEWGRWASIANDPRVALDAAALTLEFAVQQGAQAVWVRILPGNQRLIAFHKMLGYSKTWTITEGTFMRADMTEIPTITRRLSLV